MCCQQRPAVSRCCCAPSLFLSVFLLWGALKITILLNTQQFYAELQAFINKMHNLCKKKIIAASYTSQIVNYYTT